MGTPRFLYQLMFLLEVLTKHRLTWSSTMICRSSLAREVNLIMRCTCTELAELAALAEKMRLIEPTVQVLCLVRGVESLLVTGAVFNLLCGQTDEVVMTKIENYFQHKVAEVPNWKSEDNFETALKDAGLLV